MGLAVVRTTPPASMNVAPGQHHNARHRRKRQRQGELATLLLAAEVPRPIPGGRVHATAELLFPTHRRRDEGNYRTALEKALGDALAPHDPEHPFRWLEDDTPEHFTFGAVTFGRTDHVNGESGRRRPAEAIISIAWGEDIPAALAARAADEPLAEPAEVIELEWSDTAIVNVGDELHNVFQLNTWAIRATFPAGDYRIVVLERGAAQRIRRIGQAAAGDELRLKLADLGPGDPVLVEGIGRVPVPDEVLEDTGG